MSRVIVTAEPIRVSVRYVSDADEVDVSCSADTLADAVAALFARFGEMRDDCAEELARVGIRVAFASDEKPESVS